MSSLAELNTYPYSGHSAILNKRKREWQDVKYVLSYFGRNTGNARKGYLKLIREGLDQGRKPELVGGGLIRSLGGWTEVKPKEIYTKGSERGDERILGDSSH